jgi:hypothetical protein
MTAVEALNHQTRLQILQASSPAEAETMIDDAVLRDDRAFIENAALVIPVLAHSKNSWQGDNARAAVRVQSKLEDAAFNERREAATYAQERIEAYRVSWRFLAHQLLGKDGDLDPITGQLGGLSPLINPPAA